MIKKLLFLLLLAGWMTACSSGENQETDADASADETEMNSESTENEEGDGKHFGETITADDALTYSVLYSKMAETDSMPAKVVATVNAVCQAKGCWMDVAAEQEGVEPMKVRFKDYGFFVPKDIAGRKVVMEGYAYREITSVDELRHYAEDEGLSQEEIEKITEPLEELKFMASGVLLMDEEEGK